MSQAVDRVRELASIVLFADLSQPELQAVDHIFDEEVFDKGRRILRQGFQGSNFYVIVDGEAQVRIDGGDLARLARGDYFGEISLLLGCPPIADVVALTSLRCRLLPGAELQSFLLGHPSVMYRMLQGQAMRLQATSQRPD